MFTAVGFEELPNFGNEQSLLRQTRFIVENGLIVIAGACAHLRLRRCSQNGQIVIFIRFSSARRVKRDRIELARVREAAPNIVFKIPPDIVFQIVSAIVLQILCVVDDKAVLWTAKTCNAK